MNDNNPIRFGQHCAKCGMPKINCVCIQQIKINPQLSGKKQQSVSRSISRMRVILEELKLYYSENISKHEDKGDGWINNMKAEYHIDVADYTEAIRILKEHEAKIKES